MTITLVLGGARSGKSAHAESRLAGERFLYLATSQPQDDDMRQRVQNHIDRRGPHWHTVEEPLDLVQALSLHAASYDGVLVDCLTLWLSNLMYHERDVAAALDALCAYLPLCPVPVVLVSNELGLGLVPETKLGRDFRDWQGIVNQRVAAACTCVVFVAAGLPLVLKDQS